jgi:hypothetical protein
MAVAGVGASGGGGGVGGGILVRGGERERRRPGREEEVERGSGERVRQRAVRIGEHLAVAYGRSGGCKRESKIRGRYINLTECHLDS